ncbi:G-type lectin S-receptor-like serine/threonine-protein kinase SD2-5 [Canna indica]|uniref:G-type lectin S-receptor-like serine/threonine-protein kinase SD2-5 n=1 Tax=Canna indica TaxID=4628 RepID=A0AAQ3KI68_9LILI|nr:G-type lectin S-receptor-like serine/threonine-protein kinase SD2-5 [Canna indica]
MSSVNWVTFISTLLFLFLTDYIPSLLFHPVQHNQAQRRPSTAANVSTLITDDSMQISFSQPDGSVHRSVFLLCNTSSASAACTFFCNNTCEAFLLAILHFDNQTGGIANPQTASTSRSRGFLLPAVDRDDSVKGGNTTFPFSTELTEDGDVILRDDVDGAVIWSTVGAAEKLVLGVNVTRSADVDRMCRLWPPLPIAAKPSGPVIWTRRAPPSTSWRRPEYMRTKWFSPHRRTIAMDEAKEALVSEGAKSSYSSDIIPYMFDLDREFL